MRVPLIVSIVIAFAAAIPVVSQQGRGGPIVPPVITSPPGSAAVEQKTPGAKAAATIIESFDGLGVGFEGPQGPGRGGNPSDNSLAVGLNHIVQTVNSRMAIFTKKGKQFDTTGKVLYGSVATSNVFKGFGGTCEAPLRLPGVKTIISTPRPESSAKLK